MSTSTIAAVASVAQRAATDASFRSQLLSSPVSTLQGAGVSVPGGTNVTVLENTSDTVHLVLPSRPSGISDSDLQQTGPTSLGKASSVPIALDNWSRLVIETWTDSALASQLMSDPASTLAGRGISLSASTIKIVKAGVDDYVLVIPPAQ
jgi:hypothetical protein